MPTFEEYRAFNISMLFVHVPSCGPLQAKKKVPPKCANVESVAVSYLQVQKTPSCYEGVSINNQPIPFPMDRDGHDFQALFQYMFYTVHGYKIAHVSSHSLIRYWMSNMASDANACFSSEVGYLAVIRYLYFKGKTGKEIHGELADVYGSSAPSYAKVKFWVGEFKRRRWSQVWTPTGCHRRRNV